MKEKYKKCKEMLKNPKKKALFKLGCWFFFFAILYLIILIVPHANTSSYRSSSSNRNTITNDAITNLLNMSSFEYVYTFSYLDEVVEITGVFYENQYYFQYLDSDYYAKENTVCLVDFSNHSLVPTEEFLVLLSLRELSKEVLYDWLTNGELMEKKEYSDGKTVSTYRYKLEENHYIEMTITENAHIIDTIHLDLTDYFQSKAIEYDSFQVELQYQEVNNLVSYSKNYEDYEILGGDL